MSSSLSSHSVENYLPFPPFRPGNIEDTHADRRIRLTQTVLPKLLKEYENDIARKVEHLEHLINKVPDDPGITSGGERLLKYFTQMCKYTIKLTENHVWYFPEDAQQLNKSREEYLGELKNTFLYVMRRCRLDYTWEENIQEPVKTWTGQTWKTDLEALSRESLGLTVTGIKNIKLCQGQETSSIFASTDCKGSPASTHDGSSVSGRLTFRSDAQRWGLKFDPDDSDTDTNIKKSYMFDRTDGSWHIDVSGEEASLLHDLTIPSEK